MFGLFKKSPLKQLQKDYEALLTKAFQAQRDGNIRLYSELTAESDVLRLRIEGLKSTEAAGH